MFENLKKLFGFTTKRGSNFSDVKIELEKINDNDKSQDLLNNNNYNYYKPREDYIQQQLEKWLENNTISNDDLFNRNKRIRDLRDAFINDPLINKFIGLVSDELIYTVEDNELYDIIKVLNITNKDFELYTRNFFKKIGLNTCLFKNIIKELVLYGDCFLGLTITKKGVQNINIIPQDFILDRLVFNPSKSNVSFKTFTDYWKNTDLTVNKIQAITDLYGDECTNNDGYYNKNNLNFQDYDFGYILKNNLTAYPWEILHIKLNKDNILFFPYGESPCLIALPINNQLNNLIALQSVARSMAFPVKLFKVHLQEGITPEKAFSRIQIANQQYHNYMQGYNSEVDTINSEIWCAENYLDFDFISPDIDFKYIEDIKFLQDRELSCFPVPKGYFNIDEHNTWTGKSGVSLIEQYKPFAKFCYSIQTTILNKIADLIKIHLNITNDFNPNINFSLGMSYPMNSEDESNKLTNTKDRFEFCMSVLNNLLLLNGYDENDYIKLPKHIIYNIFKIFGGFTENELKSLTDNMQEFNLRRVLFNENYDYYNSVKYKPNIINKLNNSLASLNIPGEHLSNNTHWVNIGPTNEDINTPTRKILESSQLRSLFIK